jgi:hypothetical protein
MKIHLLNSAMMPAAGFYRLEKIEASLFFHIIRNARPGTIKSWIGYPQNAEFIQKHTGYRPELTRDITEIQDGDRLLIMKLKYRTTGLKGGKVSGNDFEYFIGAFFSDMPVLSFYELQNTDIFEPDMTSYIQRICYLKGGEAAIRQWHSIDMKFNQIDPEDEETWKKVNQEYLKFLSQFFP